MPKHTTQDIQISLQHDAAEEGMQDNFSFEFDDAALERALRTVSWNPRDVGHFLRASRARDATSAA